MNKIIFNLFILSLLLFSCKSPQSSVNSMESMQDESGVIDPLHNSLNSLDWTGTYSGILPCADCMGIQTQIKLNIDNSYERVSVYIGKSDEKQIDAGNFSWHEDGRSIAMNGYNGPITIYKVEENQLRLLDQEGKIIEGDLADNYILQKNPSPIVNKYWKATEIMGQEVDVSTDMKREPHLIIRLNGEFSGNGGCNSMFGSFNLKGKNGIVFSEIAMSEMACLFENYDQTLSEALTMANQFIMIDEEHMQLIVGKRAPLAKFEAVYF